MQKPCRTQPQSVRGAQAATTMGPPAPPQPDPAPAAGAQQPPPTSAQVPPQMQYVTMDFPFPYVKGNPIDTCMTTAGNPGECGRASADWWCRFEGCDEAVSYAESTGDRGA